MSWFIRGDILSAVNSFFSFFFFFIGGKYFLCPQPLPRVSSVQYVTIKDNYRSDLLGTPFCSWPLVLANETQLSIFIFLIS